MSKYMNNNSYLIIDTETTGLFAGIHGLIQLGAVAMDTDFNIVESFCIDVKPPEGVEITQESLDLTGFDLQRIQMGYNYSELSEKFLAFLENNFTEPPICIGQFFPFDYTQMQVVFAQTGENGRKILSYFTNKFIDTKVIAMVANLKAQMNNKPLPFPVTSLSNTGGLKDVLGLNREDYSSHDALGDVMATRDVLLKLMDSIDFTTKI
jgi:DNA polymerase III epsilon subunit-like protein